LFKRFGEEGYRALFHGLDSGRDIAIAADENHGTSHFFRHDLPLQFQPIDAGHA
jgi:lysophospholipid acyltransferase (LPLAT)-like uncharacterized protein